MTYKRSLSPFNHVITVARLGINLFALLQFKTQKASVYLLVFKVILTVLELGAPLAGFLEEVLYKSFNECVCVCVCGSGCANVCMQQVALGTCAES